MIHWVREWVNSMMLKINWKYHLIKEYEKKSQIKDNTIIAYKEDIYKKNLAFHVHQIHGWRQQILLLILLSFLKLFWQGGIIDVLILTMVPHSLT